MIDIVIIFYLIFPIFMIPFVRKADAEKSVLLTKEDSNMIKGIACLCIIMAHMSDMLRGGGYNEKWLQPFSVLGGIGVLLFFFLSGYGIYKGYGIKKIDFTFIMNRFVKIYFISVIIKAVLAIPNIAVGNGEGYLVYCLWGDWFVDVIMLQYIFFYVAKKISEICKKENTFILLNFLINVVAATVFWKLGFNARWYNGLFLFPLGLLAAAKEVEILGWINKKWMITTAILFVMSIISGGIFCYFKGNLWADAVKTVSGALLSGLFVNILHKVRLSSPMLAYMGKRSLYFYIIHLNILNGLNFMGNFDKKKEFYIVIVMTILMVVILNLFIKKVESVFMMRN